MTNITTNLDFAKESVKAGSYKPRSKEANPSELAQSMSQSFTTGLMWAAQQQQTLTNQAIKQTNNSQKGELNTSKQSAPELLGPSVEDIAVLSSTVSTREESVESLNQYKSLFNSSLFGVNIGALEESFKEIYKKSKSHNMLIERFMSNMKLSGLNALMGLFGVDPERIDQIKAQVREQALKEIDSKLSQDWAYTKAMLEITGGI